MKNPPKNHYTFSLISSRHGLLTKRISLEQNEIKKEAQCYLNQGKVKVTQVENLKEFDQLLNSLQPHQAITLGIPKSLNVGEEAPLFSKKMAPEGALTRTKDNFCAPSSHRIVLLDYDPPKGIPPLTPEELRAKLLTLAPELKEVEMLIRPSTSSGIVKPDGTSGQDSGGLHCYLGVSETVEIETLGNFFKHREWLNDCGRIEVGKTGALLVRSLLDQAVFSWERLDFVAPPVLRDGLTRHPPESHYFPGEPLECIPEISENERSHVEFKVESARAVKQPEAEKVKGSYKKTETKKLRTKYSYHQAEEIILRAVEKQELSGAYPICVEGDQVTASDLLAWSSRFDGCTVQDPDGGDCHDRSMIFAKPGEPIKIHSFRHGGQLFSIKRQTLQYRANELDRTFRELDAALSCGTIPCIFQRSGDLVILYDEKLILLNKNNMSTHIGRFVEFYTMTQDRQGQWVRKPCNPECQFWAAYLTWGCWKLFTLRGLVSTPFVWKGLPVTEFGYHAETGLFLCKNWHYKKMQPKQALKYLMTLMDGFPFATEADKIGAIAMYMSAIQRPALKTAPLFAVNATAPGSGKSLLSEGVGIMATGEIPPMLTFPYEKNELPKILLAMLRLSRPVVVFDNVGATQTVQGESLCSLLTSGKYSGRVLGESKVIEIKESITLWIVNGNGIKMGADESRRTIQITIDPKQEKPETRHFEKQWDQICNENRGEMINALLALLLVEPEKRAEPMGSYDQWGGAVSDPLLTVSNIDIVSLKVNSAIDPELERLTEFLDLWYLEFNLLAHTLSEARAKSFKISSWLDQEFTRYGQYSAKAAGNWLRGYEGRIVGGFRIVRAGVKHSAVQWRLEIVDYSVVRDPNAWQQENDYSTLKKLGVA